MIPQDAHTYLDSFINYERQRPAADPALFKLRRVELVLEELGRPHQDLKIVHVAGSKGKGSTCTFLSHILKSAGYRVGLYTSPHLENVRERIRVLGTHHFHSPGIFSDSIREEDFSSLLQEISPVLERYRQTAYGRLSYFEVLTILALLFFQREQVDVAVLETGMGGRLDATNVVAPLVSVLTPISLEHTTYLGTTLSAIAREKAAVIKPKSFAVIAPQAPEVRQVIEDRCRETGASSVSVGRDVSYHQLSQDVQGQSFQVKGLNDTYLLQTALVGVHQMVNAVTAVAAAEALSRQGIPVISEAVKTGIADTFWPGRFEKVSDQPCIVLDGAHSPAACEGLAATVNEVFPDKRITLILGCLQDKDVGAMCRILDPVSEDVILTQPHHPRAWKIPENTKELFPGKSCRVAQGLPQVLGQALTTASENDVILVTGSFYLVGEARRLLKKERALCINGRI